ncbi:dienelactone hydrolase family protein [Aquihabitans sp. G128]|uniref:dienelactone hydrolase family protein n=1 Tax=Aquihabitans sp. G128 TaxID=2849779 RepID=UPI001C20FE7D|nr:dienelactone hydrolase family protein [Aquihabitans sp. G128]QXC62218.1 dienelactone hydrolase family protein [Aquihabitans sp. G128]
MPTIDLEVPTPDGTAPASLHVPEGDGPWPGVLLYPDAGSTRQVFRELADRLAGLGHAVLLPDVYYRAGSYEPFSIATVFTDPGEMARLAELAGALTPARAAADARAFADLLDDRPEVADGPIGTTGYCMGGRLSLTAAGTLGGRVGAAASFHGGRLAVVGDPGSPHLGASTTRAVVYVAAARDDPHFDGAEAARLHEAYLAAGVDHTIETYAGAHGFAVPDNPTFDEAASERHFQALAALFDAHLG